jgi:hypothetical protein
MPDYVLAHELRGERARLALMSKLLDPMHRRCIDALDVVKPGARTLEVGVWERIHFYGARRPSQPRRNRGSSRSGFIAS